MFLIALALAATQVEPPTTSRTMAIEIVRDPITDRLRATATLRAEGERIEIRCESPDWGEVSVRYVSRHWLARGNFISGDNPLIFRFDDHAPQRRLWHVNDRIASFDGRNRVIAFVNSLLTAERLVLRGRDIENRSFDATFPIGDTRDAIVQLLHTCGSHRLNPRIIGQQ